MNQEQATKLLEQLGITGVDPSKVVAVATLLQQLDTNEEEEEEETSLYVPKAGKGFYYDAEGLREVSRPDPKPLRKLTSVSSKVFRRLLNIE